MQLELEGITHRYDDLAALIGPSGCGKSTLPSILSAFRISASVGIILLVAAEMVAAQYGIGAYIIQQQALFQLDRLMAGVVLLMVLGLLVLT